MCPRLARLGKISRTGKSETSICPRTMYRTGQSLENLHRRWDRVQTLVAIVKNFFLFRFLFIRIYDKLRSGLFMMSSTSLQFMTARASHVNHET